MSCETRHISAEFDVLVTGIGPVRGLPCQRRPTRFPVGRVCQFRHTREWKLFRLATLESLPKQTSLGLLHYRHPAAADTACGRPSYYLHVLQVAFHGNQSRTVSDSSFLRGSPHNPPP